ncbi:MAG: hypothetical protein QM765_10320 [Myxococcales bacterium]
MMASSISPESQAMPRSRATMPSKASKAAPRRKKSPAVEKWPSAAAGTQAMVMAKLVQVSMSGVTPALMSTRPKTRNDQ